MAISRRTPFSFALLSILVLALVLVVSATTASAEKCTNVCDQTYALCIAATCSDNGDRTATCACTVETGWSVGPTPCSEREPIVDGGVTKLVSTFSTALYDTQRFYEGSGPSADCYGGACTTTDGEIATCTCKMGGGTAWWSEAACSAPPSGMVYSAAGSPFAGGRLAHLAKLIAECSGTTAPTPLACNGD